MTTTEHRLIRLEAQLQQVAHDAKHGIEAEQKIDTHEAVCAERYAGINEGMRGQNARLKRIEQIMIVATGGILLELLHGLITAASK